MNYNVILDKVANLYRGHEFVFKDKPISVDEMFSQKGLFLEKIIAKANVTNSFLFNTKVSYTRVPQEDGSETIKLNADSTTFFIIILVIIDVMEEMVVKTTEGAIQVDKFL